MSFLAELKRRNVPRALLAYGAAGWFLVEVADTAVPAFGLPNSLVGILITVLLVGTVPVAVLSWIYEWSPDGLKLDSEADHNSSAVADSRKRIDRAIIVVLLLAVGLFSVDKFILEPARDEQLAEQVRTETLTESFDEGSIAVLPFANMSDDADNEYFSDGVSEELLNLLAKIPRLRVISRTSAFQFKGTNLDIPAIAEQLDVVYVLEGSVRKHRDTVRITAQLVDSRTDAHLWSETYDRKLDDVFAIQDEIAAAIVGELRTTLSIDTVPSTSSAPTSVPKAHEAYLRGRFLIAKRTPEAVRAAVEEFKIAVNLDPDYALAHAELSLALRRLAIIGDVTRDEAVAMSLPPAERAMQLDPTMAQAHSALGYALLSPDTFDLALEHFRRATKLNPNYSDAHMWLGGFLGQAGDYAESFRMTKTAARLDPLSRPAVANYAIGLIRRNELQEALEQMERLKAIDESYFHASGLASELASTNGSWANGILVLEGVTLPDDANVNGVRMAMHEVSDIYAILGFAEQSLSLKDFLFEISYYLLGRHEEAVEAVNPELLEPYPGNKIIFGLAMAAVGDYDAAQPWLEESFQRAKGRVSDGYFWAEAAVALHQIRVAAGDESGGSEIIRAIRDNVSRYKDAEYSATLPQVSVEFEQGIADLLAGDTERGMTLIEQAVDNGYFIVENAAFFRILYDQPGFDLIIKKQRIRQQAERRKVLEALCKPGAQGLFWELSAEDCVGY